MWFGWAAMAWGAEPDPAAIEIVVQGERLATAREAVDQAMRDLGYARWFGGDDRGVWLTGQLWKPWVVIDEDGFARIHAVRVLPIPGRRTPETPFPGVQSGASGNTANWVGVTAITQSRNAVRGQRAKIVWALEPALAELRDARWEVAKVERAAQIRAELVGIWVDGVAPDGRSLPTFPERRAALVARWAWTADGAGGDWARDLIAAYIVDVVEVSDHPFEHADLAMAWPATER